MELHLIYKYKIVLLGMALLNVLYLAYDAISVYDKNGISLNIASNYFDTDIHGVSRQTVSRIVKRVSVALASKREQFISFPENTENLKMKFYEIARMPNIIGAIDGTHIRIKNPGGEYRDTYICRKGYHSLNVQVICDSDCKIMDIVARWRGSTHDSRIWNECNFKTKCEAGEINGILLGDNGYPCSQFLLTPLLNPRPGAESRYNTAHVRTRGVVERLFGRLKMKFRAAYNTLQINLNTVKATIIAIAILHNMAVEDYVQARKYIIDTPGCRIENLNPFSSEIREYVYKVQKVSCQSHGLLTYITRIDDEVILNINNSRLHDYSAFKIDCCYSTIKRNTTGPKPDDNLSFSDCIYFNDTVTINENFVKVECSNFFHKVYENVHATLQPPKRKVPNKDDPNVLLIGIDGVSRSNLIRSMPGTFEFCERNNWINLKGYNKIADNTYPNLMAVLTGMNYSQAINSCDPYNKSALNNCQHFIWNKYKNLNYSTAYAEDTPKIATFNGLKAGFTDPPTDYYFRPYFLATDNLSIKYLCLKAHCTGPEKTGIRMQGIIKDFMSTIRNSTPGFGLFWMNSFSHEDVNCPTSMDEDFVDFFEELESGRYLDNTIVIFFSDHGFRFGRIRLTHTGWMEERLPFIYIWIPYSFRLNHAEEYTNLLENSEKLTTPYDIYMTLQHILSLSDKNFNGSPSQGCPQCQSLFKSITSTRTCHNSGIPQHFCTCSSYEKINQHSSRLKEIGDFFVEKINNIVRSYGNVSKGCSTYFLDRISHAKSLIVKQGVEENILIGVVTNPEAIFEGTIKIIYGRNGTDKTFFLMETSRLDRYAPKTFCVHQSPVQMYCYCKSILKRFTNIFCNNKFCFL